MTLHTLKIFALKRVKGFCNDKRKADNFLYLQKDKIVYPLTADFQQEKEKTNTRKKEDLAFHMQGLLFLSKNKPLNYKIKKDKFLTEFI